MHRVDLPQPVQLIAAVIFSDANLLSSLEKDLGGEFGKIELRSEAFRFNVTDYYQNEMGNELYRIFYSFEELLSPEDIVDVKVTTNGIEERYAVNGKREVNIDPGYMDFYKLVLVSNKFLGQKIYLGKGVYADPTLYYDKGWRHYSWGFPDFKGGLYNHFLTQVRERYKAKIRGMRER